MQALSSSALGAPVEAQAASEPVVGDSYDVEEGRRIALERINASQRHRMGVIPGVITVCWMDRLRLIRSCFSRG